MEYILLTGGAGYIGSHTCAEFLNSGQNIVVVDNLSNSNADNLARLNNFGTGNLVFIKSDLQDKKTLTKIFETYNIKSVVHFAGLKAVGESVQNPILYYNNNIGCTLSLLDVCNKFNCKNIVFSSSATVYGEPVSLPIKEEFELKPTSPYGTSKLIIEKYT
jgi:UDP-glucose 4-epimerase